MSPEMSLTTYLHASASQRARYAVRMRSFAAGPRAAAISQSVLSSSASTGGLPDGSPAINSSAAAPMSPWRRKAAPMACASAPLRAATALVSRAPPTLRRRRSTSEKGSPAVYWAARPASATEREARYAASSARFSSFLVVAPRASQVAAHRLWRSGCSPFIASAPFSVAVPSKRKMGRGAYPYPLPAAAPRLTVLINLTHALRQPSWRPSLAAPARARALLPPAHPAFSASP